MARASLSVRCALYGAALSQAYDSARSADYAEEAIGVHPSRLDVACKASHATDARVTRAYRGCLKADPTRNDGSITHFTGTRSNIGAARCKGCSEANGAVARWIGATVAPQARAKGAHLQIARTILVKRICQLAQFTR